MTAWLQGDSPDPRPRKRRDPNRRLIEARTEPRRDPGIDQPPVELNNSELLLCSSSRPLSDPVNGRCNLHIGCGLRPSNPYGTPNPEGIYVIDCQGGEFRIKDLRGLQF